MAYESLNLLGLVCASLASLALGVLLAYGICRVAFFVFRIHSRSVAAHAQQKAAAAAVARVL